MTHRQKIAILGGGVGGIATAWGLTQIPDWRERFEITVYQMGWRLGGKGASGRNAACGQRIEEHGLHVWLGFYDTAFRAMRAAYEELGRPKGAPLDTWQHAFTKHSTVVIMEEIRGDWRPWQIDFKENDDLPGEADPAPLPTEFGYLRLLLEWMVGHYHTHLHSDHGAGDGGGEIRHRPWLSRVFHTLGEDIDEVAAFVEHAGMMLETAALYAALRLAQALDDDASSHDTDHHEALTRLLDEFAGWLRGRISGHLDADDESRRVWILLDLSLAMTRGMVADGVVTDGFRAITGWDFREWLRRHGADDTSVDSGLVKGLYDLVFAYEQGDTARPNFNAGAAMRSIVSMIFDYKGAIFWKMQAGMGDTVFTPFYEVLRRRGVRFEFFHKVENLGLSSDGSTVDTLRMQRQVWLAGHPQDSSVVYEPLVDVNGLACWPAAPDLAQIRPDQAAAIASLGIDLESYYADWAGAETRTLERGRDFDIVVLAIPPGAHPFICGELIERNEAFRAMVDHVSTVQTQALQLWMTPDLDGLGWHRESPVLDAYAEPLNTWADMSHLIPREAWPPEVELGSIAYLCGPRRDADDAPTVEEIREGRAEWFARRENDRVREENTAWLSGHAAGLWPDAASPGRGVDPDALVGCADEPPKDRLAAQYHRANFEPSERYVLSPKGSDRHRLGATGAGIDNLVLAGDWTDNGFLNAGCVEATVLSGLRAAQAIADDDEEG